MFFLDEGEFVGLLFMWLVFMTVVGVYVIRIGMMLREQRAMERYVRLKLAIRRGREAREAAERAGS